MMDRLIYASALHIVVCGVIGEFCVEIMGSNGAKQWHVHALCVCGMRIKLNCQLPRTSNLERRFVIILPVDGFFILE